MGWQRGAVGGGSGVTFAAPSDVIEIGDVASEGVSPNALRADAVFALPAGGAPADVAAAAGAGASTAVARADHVHRVAPLSITNAMLAGAIALSKLATDPLARANHTGTQLAATISDFAAAVAAVQTEATQDIVGALLADTGVIDFTYDDVGNVETATIKPASVTAAMMAAGDPYARANHTGTQLAATISDLGAAIDARVALVAATRTGSAQPVANTTVTYIDLTTEELDSHGFHDNVTNPSRLTVPAGQAGVYLGFGSVDFSEAGTDTAREAFIAKNAAGTSVSSAGQSRKVLGGQGTVVLTIGLFALAVGDYVRLGAWQDSGGSLNAGTTTSRLSLVRIAA